MSIFVIILLSLIAGLLLGGLYALIIEVRSSHYNSFKKRHWIIFSIIVLLITLIGTFAEIGINTQDAKAYCAKFEAQKTTIEYSLECEDLSGLERVELVNKAVELNGELAEKKAWADVWHIVYYDNDIYGDLEPITFDRGDTE